MRACWCKNCPHIFWSSFWVVKLVKWQLQVAAAFGYPQSCFCVSFYMGFGSKPLKYHVDDGDVGIQWWFTRQKDTNIAYLAGWTSIHQQNVGPGRGWPSSLRQNAECRLCLGHSLRHETGDHTPCVADCRKMGIIDSWSLIWNFHKLGYPQIINFHPFSGFHYKASSYWGIPHLWKHGFGVSWSAASKAKPMTSWLRPAGDWVQEWSGKPKWNKQVSETKSYHPIFARHHCDMVLFIMFHHVSSVPERTPSWKSSGFRAGTAWSSEVMFTVADTKVSDQRAFGANSRLLYYLILYNPARQGPGTIRKAGCKEIWKFGTHFILWIPLIPLYMP